MKRLFGFVALLFALVFVQSSAWAEWTKYTSDEFRAVFNTADFIDDCVHRTVEVTVEFGDSASSGFEPKHWETVIVEVTDFDYCASSSAAKNFSSGKVDLNVSGDVNSVEVMNGEFVIHQIEVFTQIDGGAVLPVTITNVTVAMTKGGWKKVAASAEKYKSSLYKSNVKTSIISDEAEIVDEGGVIVVGGDIFTGKIEIQREITTNITYGLTKG